MKEIVRNNSQLFPGKNITHKLLLIRKGEIRMSEIALGYSLAIVLYLNIRKK